MSNLLEQAEKLTSHFAPFLEVWVLHRQPWRSTGLHCLPAHRSPCSPYKSAPDQSPPCSTKNRSLKTLSEVFLQSYPLLALKLLS